ncbi:MAG: FtsX-like permease family protein [Gammaproteobacteria bacterium]|nr:FtsX-like permease family protein [Gammaproteobacteria bacterium]
MSLTLLLQLASRNLWRHRRRNSLLLVSIAFAVVGLVFASSFIRAFQGSMQVDVIAALNGHIKALAAGYQDDPSLNHSFALDDTWRPNVPESQVMGWAARISLPGVVMSERETRGIELVGVDPQAELSISFLGESEIEGEGLEGPEDGKLLIGAALAQRLQTGVGRRVVVITEGADGVSREIGYRITGLYRAKQPSVERIIAFTGIKNLQSHLDTTAYTEVSMRLNADEFEAGAKTSFKSDSAFTDVNVFDWRELNPEIAQMVELADFAFYIWFAILWIALSFGLVNALLTSVFERIREIGMLRTLGMRPASVLVQIVLESQIVVFYGLVLGILVGAGLVYLFQDGIDLAGFSQGLDTFGMRSVIVPQLLAADIIRLVVLSFVLGLVASLYPAWRALRLRPLVALQG